MVHGVAEEIRIDEDAVGRLERGVVLEEHRGWYLWSLDGLVIVYLSRACVPFITFLELILRLPISSCFLALSRS